MKSGTIFLTHNRGEATLILSKFQSVVLAKIRAAHCLFVKLTVNPSMHVRNYEIA